MSACHGAESRTPNPLVDKVIPQSYRKTPWKRPYCTNSSNTRQQHLKGSKMLQLSFSISPTSRAQGHAPRGEKIPKLGMENWQCRSAVKPGGQDILLGHTSGLRRMQEQTNTSQQLPKHGVALWVTQCLQGGAKPLSSTHDPGVSPLSFHGQLQPWQGGTSWEAERGLALCSTLWVTVSFLGAEGDFLCLVLRE